MREGASRGQRQRDGKGGEQNERMTRPQKNDMRADLPQQRVGFVCVNVAII